MVDGCCEKIETKTLLVSPEDGLKERDEFRSVIRPIFEQFHGDGVAQPRSQIYSFSSHPG